MIKSLWTVCLVGSLASAAPMNTGSSLDSPTNATCPFTVRCDPFREAVNSGSFSQTAMTSAMTKYIPDLLQLVQDGVFDACCWARGIRQCFQTVLPETLSRLSPGIDGSLMTQAVLPAFDQQLKRNLPAGCDLTLPVHFKPNKASITASDPVVRESKPAYYRNFQQSPTRSHMDLYSTLSK